MNKKQLSKDTKAAKKQVSKPNAFSKDVIVTKRGQWDYPGQVTRIPGNQITMKNVPYPVLGIDDQGNQQMMFPGQDYVFPGSYVTEYPQMQEGGQNFDPEMMYRDQYNTPLRPGQQRRFDKWATKESERQGRDILMDKGAYDVQGFWKSGDYKHMDKDNHGSDTWKKPNHPTFSTGSKYVSETNPGGLWLEDGSYYPSYQTSQLYSPEYYQWLFGREPNRPEHYAGSLLPQVTIMGKKQQGGEPYQELELDDDQIAYYRSLGYRVEEVPTMQDGGEEKSTLPNLNKPTYVEKPNWWDSPAVSQAAKDKWRKENPGILVNPKTTTAVAKKNQEQEAWMRQQAATKQKQEAFVKQPTPQPATNPWTGPNYGVTEEEFIAKTTSEKPKQPEQAQLKADDMPTAQRQARYDLYNSEGYQNKLAQEQEYYKTLGLMNGMSGEEATTNAMEMAGRTANPFLSYDVKQPYYEQAQQMRTAADIEAGLFAFDLLGAGEMAELPSVLLKGAKTLGTKALGKGSTQYVKSYTDDLVKQLRQELSEKGIVEFQKTPNLPWKEVIRKGIKPFGYDIPEKFDDVRSLLINKKNPHYISPDEMDGQYKSYLKLWEDSPVKPDKERFLKMYNQDNYFKTNKERVLNRFTNRFAKDTPLTDRNRYATWDMYLGKPQSEHPMYDISDLTKSKKDVVYTIKDDFMHKDSINRKFGEMLTNIEDMEASNTFMPKTYTKNKDTWKIQDTDHDYFGTMGGFNWEVKKLGNGNYKILANDVWDLHPFNYYPTTSPLSKPLKNIEVGKALGIGKPLNVKVGFIVDGKTKKIINTFGLATPPAVIGASATNNFGLQEGWGKGQQPSFQQGGEPFETEMSDDAIEYYRRLGYRIEEI
jgi:hypothetical protein